MTAPRKTPTRLAAGLVHLASSAAVVGLVAALVFGIWYPGPFRQLAGAFTLFLILAGVDVVLGPLLTLVVFNPAKPRRLLAIDLGVIVAVQLAALGYGVWTMAAARPVLLGFEVDLFRVVTAVDVVEEQLPEAPPALQALSWTGPRLVGSDKPAGQQQIEATMLGLSGIHLAMQPRYWVPFDAQRQQVWQRGRELSALPAQLQRRLPADLMPWPGNTIPALTELRWLPALSARASWTVFVDRSGSPVAFAPFDAP